MRLQTARLLIRPYGPQDREHFVALNTDAVIRQHMDGPLPEAAAQAFFDRLVSDGGPSEVWAIERLDTGDYVGHIFIAPEPGLDAPAIGFLLCRDAWGKGYATEAATCVLKHALSHHPRIEATVDADHSSSIQVLEKLGMQRLRQEEEDGVVYFVYGIEGNVETTG